MNGSDYFKLAISKYAQFEGRSRRSEYWYFALFYVLILIALVVAEAVLFQTMITYLIGVLFFIVPALAVSVRRLHDVGKSGWYYLITLIPLVGPIVFLVWACTDSQYGANAWGPNPKGEGNGSFSQDEEVDLSRHLIDDDLV